MDELIAKYETWNAENIPALWQDPHIENVRKEEATRQLEIDKARRGEK